MKPIKTLLVASIAGIMAFTANKALAVRGEVTISGTASYQDNVGGLDVVKTHVINQKLILQMLAEATGDASITNKPTKLLYDPDAFNYNWYYSDNWDGSSKYGVFYYSNSIAGLRTLDGYDSGYNYYSYIELNSYAGYGWGFYRLGFVDPDLMEYNQAVKEGSSSVAITGHAVLYIHSNRNYFNILEHHYYANNYYGYYNSRALVIRGLISLNAADKGSTITESFTLQGTGDGVWYDSEAGYLPLVVSKGKVSFKGTGPD